MAVAQLTERSLQNTRGPWFKSSQKKEAWNDPLKEVYQKSFAYFLLALYILFVVCSYIILIRCSPVSSQELQSQLQTLI